MRLWHLRRIAHPYLIADRFEDITPAERLRQDAKADREVSVYGFLRGANMKPGARVHLAGVGDFTVCASSKLVLRNQFCNCVVKHTDAYQHSCQVCWTPGMPWPNAKMMNPCVGLASWHAEWGGKHSSGNVFWGL